MISFEASKKEKTMERRKARFLVWQTVALWLTPSHLGVWTTPHYSEKGSLVQKIGQDMPHPS